MTKTSVYVIHPRVKWGFFSWINRHCVPKDALDIAGCAFDRAVWKLIRRDLILAWLDPEEPQDPLRFGKELPKDRCNMVILGIYGKKLHGKLQ